MQQDGKAFLFHTFLFHRELVNFCILSTGFLSMRLLTWYSQTIREERERVRIE